MHCAPQVPYTALRTRVASVAVVVLGCILLWSPQAVQAGVIAEYDWDDGTTQGWNPVSINSNDGGRLRFDNDIAAVVQISSPAPPDPNDWSAATQVSFDLEFISYLGINGPDELDVASLTILSGESLALATLAWDLPIANWNFNEMRTFTLFIADGIFRNDLTPAIMDVEDLLANVAFARLTFWADDEVPIDQTSGLLDNFVISVPEATGGTPIAFAVILMLARRRL
jgi:hypothetical protein